MIAAISVLLLSIAESVKYIDIDRFDTPPYQLMLAKRQSGGHEWFGLPRSGCLFPRRAVNAHVGPYGDGSTLTLTIGNHEQKISTNGQLAWTYSLQENTDGNLSIDFSAVDNFLVDMYAIGGSYLPDAMTLSVHDNSFHGGTAGWNGRIGGVLFRKSSFPQGIDWRHITSVTLRQDFDSLPNPITYSVTRFYASLKPEVLPPAPR